MSFKDLAAPIAIFLAVLLQELWERSF